MKVQNLTKNGEKIKYDKYKKNSEKKWRKIDRIGQ